MVDEYDRGRRDMLNALLALNPKAALAMHIIHGGTEETFMNHEGGSLAMCSEWQDLVRCFEHLADYAAASPVTPEGLVGGEK